MWAKKNAMLSGGFLAEIDSPKSALDHIGLGNSSIVVAAVTALVAVGTLYKKLEPFAALVNGIGRLLRRIPGLGPVSSATRARQLFADRLLDDNRVAAATQMWEEHEFTQLEAEVEAEGGPPSLWMRVTGRRDSLRRERSLTAALRRCEDRLILLEGDPGSGKSVALRKVAIDMARAARTSRNPRSPLPVFVNLRQLEAGDRPVDVDLVRDCAKASMMMTQDAVFDEYLRKEFDREYATGGWCFLFDSFDEIPAILSSSDSDDVVIAYSEAIRKFARGMGASRVIVASRSFRGPQRKSGTRFRISPLTSRRQRAFVHAALPGGKDRDVMERGLRDADSGLRQLAENPLFLRLLCEHVREKGQFPADSHSVLGGYVRRRTEAEAGQFRLPSVTVNLVAQNVAFCMLRSDGLGLSPRLDELDRAMGEQGFSVGPILDGTIEALAKMRLAEVTPALGDGDARFSFKHRRFQEYFATCVLIRRERQVPARELLIDGRWRETAVTLLQLQDGETSAELIKLAGSVIVAASAEVRLSSRPASEPGFAWPPGVLHVLGILDAASSGNRLDLDPDVVDALDFLLRAAWTGGGRFDRKWALESASLAGIEVRHRLVRDAFRSGSRWLRDVGYRVVSRLETLPPDLQQEVRNELVIQMSKGDLGREWNSTLATLKRLPDERAFVRCAQLLRLVRPVDLALWTALVVLRASTSSDPWAATVDIGPFAVVVVGLTNFYLRFGTVDISNLSFARLVGVARRPSNAQLPRSAGSNATGLRWLADRLGAFALVLRILFAVGASTDLVMHWMDARHVGGLFLLLIAAMWAPMAILAAYKGAARSRLLWPFVWLGVVLVPVGLCLAVFRLVAGLQWRRVLRMMGQLAAGGGLIGLVVLASTAGPSWMGALVPVGTFAAIIGLAVVSFVLRVVYRIRDALWLSRAQSSPRPSEQLLRSAMTELRTPIGLGGAIRLLRRSDSSRSRDGLREIATGLLDLGERIERQALVVTESLDDSAVREIQKWGDTELSDRHAKRQLRLLDGPNLDELAKLVNDLAEERVVE